MDTIKQAFDQIREASQQNEDILGFVLTGSRGKGFENRWSDYDFAIFVTEDACDKYKQQYGELPDGGRLYIFTLESFKNRHTTGGYRHWERYTWARLNVENDRTEGEIKRLLDQASHVPAEHLNDYIRQALRKYMNQVYHSLKNLRAGNIEAYHLEAAEGIRSFLEAVFALHDGRLVPYYKYLRWELETEPLTKLRLSTNELIECLREVLRTGDYRVQQKLMREAESVFSEAGFDWMFEWSMARFSLEFRPEDRKQQIS